MTDLVYTYQDNYGTAIQEKEQIEWLKKLNASTFQIKFTNTGFEPAIIFKNKILTMVASDNRTVKFENVVFKKKEDFFIGTDGVYEFTFSNFVAY